MSMTLPERYEFAEGVLTKLGAPVSPENMLILMTWMAHESSPDQEGPSPEFNPLATTKLWSEEGKFNDAAFGGRGNRVIESQDRGMSFFNDLGGDLGVMNYADIQQGIDMTVSTIKDAAFKPIRDALMQGDLSIEEFNGVAGEALSAWSSDGYSALTADADEHGITEILETPFGASTPGSFPADWANPQNQLSEFSPYHQIVSIMGPSEFNPERVAFLVISIPGYEDMATGGAVAFQLSGMAIGSLGDVNLSYDQWSEMANSTGWVIAENPPGTGGYNYSDLVNPQTGDLQLTDEEGETVPLVGFVEELLMEIEVAGDMDALNDAGVQGIIAEIIADPFMLEDGEGIKDRLDNTEWGNARSLRVQQWDGWTQGQKDAEVAAWVEKLKSQYETYVGIQSMSFDWDSEKLGANTIAQWAFLIASGASEVGPFMSQIKQKALSSTSGESPYQTIVREQSIASGQWDQDKADKTAWVEDIYRSWGLDPGTYGADVKAIANDLMMNTMSESDFMDDIRTTAMQKFPNKPEFLATKDWASPYMSLHDSEMDVPAGDFSNSLVMSALQAGEGLEAFRTRIRKTDDWKRSKKAKAVAADKMRAVGNTFGFNRGGGIF